MFARTGWVYPLLVAAVLAGSVALRLADPTALQALRTAAFDIGQRLAPAAYPANTPVRVVAIDAASLERIGPWPWPGSILALLVEAIDAAGAAVIALDLAIPEGTAEDDAALEAALAASASVLAVALTGEAAEGTVPAAKAGFAVVGDDPRPFMPSFANVLAAPFGLDQVAAGAGAIPAPQDESRLVRSVPLVARVGETVLPGLAVEILRVAEGADTYTVTADGGAGGWRAVLVPPGIRHVATGSVAVPTDRDGSMRVHLRTAVPAAHIPAWRVLAGEAGAAELDGRIVLLGLTAPDVAGFSATALDPAVAPVEVQAMAVEHILSGRTLVRPAAARAIEIAAAVFAALALAVLIPRLSLVAAVVAGLAAVALILAAGWFAFVDFDVLLDPAWPALTVWVAAASAALAFNRRLVRRRNEVHLAFGDSLAPSVVDAIIANPAGLVLGGERRELTVLCCSVRNFAGLAGRLEPRELIAFANGLYPPLSEAILAERGTISRYLGDSLTAFWNAPLDEPDHAGAASRAAMAIVAGVAAFNGREADAGRHAVVDIGIATGDCAVGNLGSGERFDYSAIGAPVDRAGRLAGLCAVYGVPVVVDEATIGRTAAAPAIELDFARLDGEADPLRFFTLLAAIDGAAAAADRLAASNGRMIDCCRDRDWDCAEAAAMECVSFRIEGLAALYGLWLGRIAVLRDDAPAGDREGAEAMRAGTGRL